ncbi:type II secretion system protein [Aminivibrio sp.]|uniref:PilW family protein n=1 Tax=Aminivibrio sp. TaxID=1872489 RepID=UPI001A61AD25|nr:type II secretion system protein [Aminivibrio sp.]MBL3540670.1 type II secretion system protein [Aminivibrio sp.]
MKRTERQAFTLVEILISILILGVVMSAVMTLFFSVFESYKFHQDMMEAKQRGQVALAAIQPYISASAMGLPNRETPFQTSFSSSSGVLKSASALLPENVLEKFTSPVQIASGDVVVSGVVNSDDISGSALWLVFAVPSGIGVENDYQIDGTGTEIELTAVPPADLLIKDTNSMKSWVAFPGSTAPMFVNAVNPSDGKKITLAARTAQKISAFDEMHYVRAVKIKIINENLNVKHLSDGLAVNEPWSPVVEGIENVRFEFTAERLLRVTVLAKGSVEHNVEYMSSIPGWDGPMPANRKFRYAAVTRTWRIRN